MTATTTTAPAPGPLDLMFHQSATVPSTLDSSANVGVVLHVRGTAPDVTSLRRQVADRMADLPCLRYLLTGAGTNVTWSSREPDVDTCVVEQTVPAGTGQVEDAVRRLRTTVLPPEAPPWRIWLLHGHEPGRYALFYLTQHDVQDAANITAVLEGLFGTSGQSSSTVAASSDVAPSTAPDVLGVLDEVVRCTRAHGMWQNPDRPLSGHREVHWVDVPVRLLRETGRGLGGSTNDVFLAAVGHAVASWAREHWPAADGPPLPVMVPVNLRSPGEVGCPGNRFFLSRVDVPGGPVSAVRRLAGTITAAAPLKSSAHRATLRRALDILPRPLLDLLTNVCTTPDQLSVVGSSFSLRNPLRVGSDPVERVVPLICCPDGFPATIAMFCYDQTASACFHLDRALPAAETIPARWLSSVEEMADALGVRATPA